MTRNPWLDIPEADYVGHMSSPGVQQLQVLAREFGRALRSEGPERVLLAGSALGNGLEQVDPSVTRRVTCVDINPRYLARVDARFKESRFELDLVCADLNNHEFAPASFDLIFAGLVLEYMNWQRALPRLARALRRGGVLAAVLQLPSDKTPVVTPTGFASLSRLEGLFHFVAPEALVALADRESLRVTERRTEPLPSHKAFEVLHFRHEGDLTNR